MSYTLYYSPDSANIVIRMVLEALVAPYQAIEIDRTVDGQRSPEFLKFNPQGLLPVLQDPAQAAPLFETAAILLHLADQHAALPVPDPKHRGELLKWLFFLSNTLHADLRVLFYSDRYVADSQAIPPLRKRMHQRVLAHLALLDTEVTKGAGAWLLGEQRSVCDYYLAACVRWSQLYPRGDTLSPSDIEKFPALTGLLQTLEARTEVQKAYAAEGMHGKVFTKPGYPTQAVV